MNERETDQTDLHILCLSLSFICGLIFLLFHLNDKVAARRNTTLYALKSGEGVSPNQFHIFFASQFL
jgi:hypothetical protein